MALVRELGTEPYIAVNTGLGGVEAAAEEIEYVNGAGGDADGASGARRTAIPSPTA